jgi:exopolysaccharide biosynthesis protein
MLRALAFSLTLISTFSQAQVVKNNFTGWKSDTIAPGLIHRTLHDSIFQANQNLNLLQVDLTLNHLELIYEPNYNIETSKMASAAGALAAVNAGFFDTRNGGSVTYLKDNGQIREQDTSGWKPNQLFNGAMLIDIHNQVFINKIKSNIWYDQLPEFNEVLVTGPILLNNGGTTWLEAVPFNTSRHPRTCACNTLDEKLILLTVDGRHQEAAGMSLFELAKILKGLGCHDAINLDGGGSTTMWLRDQGVVNKPSDNQKFDSDGERKVSSIFVIFSQEPEIKF